nr:MAG TPA: hypothetical protein [Caudoviricetes sp.]
MSSSGPWKYRIYIFKEFLFPTEVWFIFFI